ncbi:aldo/keto reductase [Colwellia sp. MEBiC06753]
MKLALGSVQFGLNYGISNSAGKVPLPEVCEILSVAEHANIRFIDTASSYGNSEKVVGNIQNPERFNYLGKISPECKPVGYMDEVNQSLSNLNIAQFYSVSTHHGNTLLGDDGEQHFQALQTIKNKGLCQKIGTSVYSPSEAVALLEKYPLDIVQLPASIFDQRIFDKNFLAFAESKKCKIHIRSIFLQGAVFLDSLALPQKLQGLTPKLSLLNEYCIKFHTNKLAIAMSPFVNHPLIDAIIIGCTNHNELKENISAYHQAQLLDIDTKAFAIEDDVIINPSKW